MKRFLQIPALFFALVLVMAVLKVGFMIVVGGFSAMQMWQVLCHGFSMDCSVAGYFTAIPALLTVASVWWQGRPLQLTLKIYFGIVATLIALIAVADTALYPYWGFKLDATPIFYFITSPSAAAASVEWWQWAVCPLAVAAVAVGIYFWLKFCSFSLLKEQSRPRRTALTVTGLVLLTALLFLPVRGGVTVSTMSPARAYFSTDMRLNHAAINPAFNLLYSLSHSSDFASRFRYFDTDRLAVIMQATRFETSGSLPRIESLPDVYLIILEGFSAHLMPSLSGDSIAMRLDSIARGGVSFSNAYASSFRTDRALPAVLNGFPGQPTSSLLKYVDKLDSLPSLPMALEKAGYNLNYYYGGDIDFANASALLVASHFRNIVSDKDFPVAQRLSKWGVPDEYVFERAARDAAEYRGPAPRLSVVQTSSSHEPYDVPYQGKFKNAKLNAFQYADSCLGDFFDRISASPRGKQALFVIVPDHYGSWPEGLTDASARHRIPLVFAGKPIETLAFDPSLLTRIASQTDIAATLCGLLGLDSRQFTFSNNLFDPARPEYAFFSEPAWYAMLTPEGRAVVAVDTHELLEPAPDSIQNLAKAYVQTLYTDISLR